MFLLAILANIMWFAAAGFFDDCSFDFAKEDFFDFVLADLAFHMLVFKSDVYIYFVKINKG